VTVQPLLAGHRDSEALLGADYVLLALGGLGGVDRTQRTRPLNSLPAS
jgi:hypothetical protein